MSPTAAQLPLHKSLAPVGMCPESLSQTRLLLFLLVSLDDNANEMTLPQSIRQAGSMSLTTPTSRRVLIRLGSKYFLTPSRIFLVLSAETHATWTNHWSPLTKQPIKTLRITLENKGAQGGKESSHFPNLRRGISPTDVVSRTLMH